MSVFQHAELLVNVHTLDDVTTREGFSLTEVEDAFVNLVEAAAFDIAERHFAGDRPEGATYIDWSGSRLQFWVSYSRRIYELVVFQFDYNERAPLVCCASQDFVFGSRSLTAQFAVTGNGRMMDVERLEVSDLRRRRRGGTSSPGGSAVPTLHRAATIVRGVWSRVLQRVARAMRRVSEACLGLMRRLAALVATLRDRAKASIVIGVLGVAYGRVLALVGCTAEKCDGAARHQKRGFAAWFGGGGGGGGGGVLAALASLRSRMLAALFGTRAPETRFETAPIDSRRDRDDRILCANPVTEDHLATLHGIKPMEPSRPTGASGQRPSTANGPSTPGNQG